MLKWLVIKSFKKPIKNHNSLLNQTNQYNKQHIEPLLNNFINMTMKLLYLKILYKIVKDLLRRISNLILYCLNIFGKIINNIEYYGFKELQLNNININKSHN